MDTHPKRILIKGASLVHGSNVEYACDVSYRLTGSNVLYCNDGKWNASVPCCKGKEHNEVQELKMHVTLRHGCLKITLTYILTRLASSITSNYQAGYF